MLPNPMAFSKPSLICLMLFLAGLYPLTAHSETTQPLGGMTIRAQLIAVDNPIISSNISGMIDHLTLQDGNFFKKGDPLVQINCRAQESELVLANVILAKKEKIQNINRRLNQLGSVSELEMAISSSEVEEALSRIAYHRAIVDNCSIIAPFDGRVVQVFVNQSQYVREGEPILEIIDNQKLEIEMIVPSVWLSWLTKEHAFTMEMDETNRTYPAVITRITGKVDPVSHSVKVYGQLAKHWENLMPGMSGKVNIHPPEALINE